MIDKEHFPSWLKLNKPAEAYMIYPSESYNFGRLTFTEKEFIIEDAEPGVYLKYSREDFNMIRSTLKYAQFSNIAPFSERSSKENRRPTLIIFNRPVVDFYAVMSVEEVMKQVYE